MRVLDVKVCGMRDAANVADVASLYPTYMGFIFYEKSPRYVPEVSAELIKYIPQEIKTVGVFVNEEMETVMALATKHNLSFVQLHGNESVAYCKELVSNHIAVIKAFGINEMFDFSSLEAYEEVVSYFLFDTQTAAHGGSGKAFDWNLLDSYRLDKPYFLSGGIDLHHATALKNFNDDRLHALDINSKFEITPAVKDVAKLSLFFEEVRS